LRVCAFVFNNSQGATFELKKLVCELISRPQRWVEGTFGGVAAMRPAFIALLAYTFRLVLSRWQIVRYREAHFGERLAPAKQWGGCAVATLLSLLRHEEIYHCGEGARREGRSSRTAPPLIATASFRLAIPRWVAFQQRPLPLHHPAPSCWGSFLMPRILQRMVNCP